MTNAPLHESDDEQRQEAITRRLAELREQGRVAREESERIEQKLDATIARLLEHERRLLAIRL